MQKPTPGPVGRALNWTLVLLYYPEYRRLATRRFMLSARLELLCAVLTLVSPFASAGVLRLLRLWFEHLRTDVAEFGRLVRTRPIRLRSQLGNDSGYQNPWI